MVVDFVRGDWRHGVDPAAVESKLKEDRANEIKAVMCVHNETSTGVASPGSVMTVGPTDDQELGRVIAAGGRKGQRLAEAKAGFRSLTEAIDTTTPAGRMMMQMVGAFAEFERAMLRERTNPACRDCQSIGRLALCKPGRARNEGI